MARRGQRWPLSAGWTLIFSGRILGAVKTDVIENWPRIASKYLDAVIDEVKQGSFDFSQPEHLCDPKKRSIKPMKRPRKTTSSTFSS